jgi:hypothetical protein
VEEPSFPDIDAGAALYGEDATYVASEKEDPVDTSINSCIELDCSSVLLDSAADLSQDLAVEKSLLLTDVFKASETASLAVFDNDSDVGGPDGLINESSTSDLATVVTVFDSSSEGCEVTIWLAELAHTSLVVAEAEPMLSSDVETM